MGYGDTARNTAFEAYPEGFMVCITTVRSRLMNLSKEQIAYR